ncbi:hypothetical protein [Sphingobacterium sp. Mn56C]|uniref:hypothetical protein n=1 Tax=Sphingobacterium sp. Mn56C TaxID=3395261 RepID=UPI003BF50D18
MKNLISIFLLILLSFSSNKNTPKSSNLNYKAFSYWIESQNKKLSDSIIIIIPDVGCTGDNSSA